MYYDCNNMCINNKKLLSEVMVEDEEITCNDCFEPLKPEDRDQYNGLCYDCAGDLWDSYMEELMETGGFTTGNLYQQ